MAGRTSDAKVARVSRYRAGYIPTHAKDLIEDKDAELEHKRVLSIGAIPTPKPKAEPQREKTHREEKVEESSSDNEEVVQIRARSLVTPQLLDIEDDDKIVGLSDDDSDDDELDRRRQRIKERAANEDSDEDRPVQQPTEIAASESESSEWETDSDAEEAEFEAYRENLRAHAPAFVSKKQRVTLEEAEKMNLEEEEDAEKLKEKRAEETKAFLQEAVLSVAAEEEKVESDEEGDPKIEYEKWKVREIARLVNEFKLRNPELVASFEEGEKITKKKERKQMKYLQKYYHKGAFYQDDETVQKADATAPTLEDKMDITLLPKVMQVKNFGKSGRTKYTHLADVDTTDRSAGWADLPGSRKRHLGSKDSPPSKRRR